MSQHFDVIKYYYKHLKEIFTYLINNALPSETWQWNCVHYYWNNVNFFLHKVKPEIQCLGVGAHHEACGILIPKPAIELAPTALEG